MLTFCARVYRERFAGTHQFINSHENKYSIELDCAARIVEFFWQVHVPRLWLGP